MRITIKLFATLREGRFDEESREFPAGTHVAQVVKALAIPENQVTLIFIDGVHAEPDHELHEGDTLALFPPIGGG